MVSLAAVRGPRCWSALGLILAAALTAAPLASCGYKLVSYRDALGDVRRVSINNLRNDSLASGYGNVVTEALLKEFQRRGALRVVTDPALADLTIGGRVTADPGRRAQLLVRGLRARIPAHGENRARHPAPGRDAGADRSGCTHGIRDLCRQRRRRGRAHEPQRSVAARGERHRRARPRRALRTADAVTPEALAAELAKGKLRPAYLLAGDQALLRDEALAALRAAVLGESPAEFNLDRFDASGCTPAALRSARDTLPVLGKRRLVWLREPDAARGAGKGLVDALPELVSDMPDTAVLVVTATQGGSALSLGEGLRVAGRPGGMSGAGGGRRAARVRGVRGGSAGSVARAGGGGAAGRTRRPGASGAAPGAREGVAAGRAGEAHRTQPRRGRGGGAGGEPVWDLTDAIGEGRARDALPLLGRLLKSGAPPPVLLGTLASHFRKLLRLRTGGAIAAPPFVQRKLERQARRYSAARLHAALRAIHDADLALKGQGGVAPTLSLERLVLGLAA